MMRARVTNMRPHDATPTVTATLTAMSQIFVRMVTEGCQSYLGLMVRGGLVVGTLGVTMGHMARVGWVRAAAVVALVGCASCYDWVAIKPADIPRFAAGSHEVERPNGRHVRFDGDVAVKVHTSQGTLTYWNPQANIENGALAISGDRAPPAEIPLTAIDRAVAGQLNTVETIATIVVCLAAAAVTVAFVTYTWFDSPYQE
jgi:hypothetical protein